MVAIFTQSAVSVLALGSRLNKCDTQLEKSSAWSVIFCLCFASFFSLTFTFHSTSVADRRRRNADRCGGVKGGRIGVGIRRVESSRPRCVRSVCCDRLVCLPDVAC